MSDGSPAYRVDGLSHPAKLIRVVLEHRGPLTVGELASEAHLEVETAREAIEELVSRGRVEPICGLRDLREEVYAVSEGDGDI